MFLEIISGLDIPLSLGLKKNKFAFLQIKFVIIIANKCIEVAHPNPILAWIQRMRNKLGKRPLS